MNLVYPINENDCRKCIGQPVRAVLLDGSECFGVLSRVEGGKIYFNENPHINTKMKTSKKKNKADVKALGGYPYAFGAAFALDLALIALLFTIPF